VRSLAHHDYARLSEAGRLVPVYREVPGDLLTPVSAFLALGHGRQRAFLLESVVGGEQVARYSFLGRDPHQALELRASALHEEDAGPRFLDALRRSLVPGSVRVPGLPRFTGGAVGYLAYDAVRLFAPGLHRALPADAVLASFAVYRSLVAFDHARQRLVLISHAEPGRRAAWEAAQDELDGLEDALRTPARGATREAAPPPEGVPFADGPAFQAAVRAAQEHIAKGDVFQVVLSRREELACEADPFSVYRALRTVNPSPYMFFLQDGDTAVAGASPEMLVRVTGRRVETRPIAGTRPRGATEAEDEALAKELLADPKERAEHVMLVDLGRNDVGRVCRFASVKVEQFMEVERYSHVAHLVSTVAGELQDGRDALDALVAAFPAGTLSGAPKIRAMQVIEELEAVARGLYGGAIGYLDFAGQLDFCIAIRTILLRGGVATVQAGAGIVADSDPAAEQRETEQKAAALREALRLAPSLQARPARAARER
jgi:anthranilate synthase component 1